MIEGVLIFNNDGKARLMNWYNNKDLKSQQKELLHIYHLLRTRPDHSCNFLDGSDSSEKSRIIYRHYATLYFCMIVDNNESELGILDLIQVFVESLDRIFTNVCELDLIFRPDDVQLVLSEIISGGMVLEVSAEKIAESIQLMSLKKLKANPKI